MTRAAVVLSLLVLLAISVVPVLRTTVESVVVRDPQGHVLEVTTRRYAELFGRAEPPAPGQAADETPANRPAAKRWAMLGNSAAIGLVSALLALAFGIPYAVLVARTDVALGGFLRTFYGAPLVLPPLLVGVAWAYLPAFQPPPQNAVPEPSVWDGPLAILRAGTMFALCYFPLVVLFATRAVRRVPAALEESARLVGGPWKALTRVTLPLAAPTLLGAGLFVFLFSLEDFALVDFLNWVRPVGQRVGVYPYESFTAWTKGDGEGIATALGVPLLLVGVGGLLLIHRLVVRNARTAIAGDFRPAATWRLGAWRWPAAAAATALLAVAAGIPVVGLLTKAGGGGAYRKVWDLVAGPDSTSHQLLWTLWYAAAAAVIALPLAFVLAHHAARKGRVWPLLLAFLPLALPPIFLGAGSLRIYESPLLAIPMPGGGARNPFSDPDSPHLGTILVLVAKYVPFAVAALWAAFLGLDPRLEEAAASAGAGPLDRALRITAPLVRPALVLSAVLVFVFSLKEIDTLVLLPGAQTVIQKIYTMVHFSRDDQVAALCVVLILLEALPFVFLALLFPRALSPEERPAA